MKLSYAVVLIQAMAFVPLVVANSSDNLSGDRYQRGLEVSVEFELLDEYLSSPCMVLTSVPFIVAGR